MKILRTLGRLRAAVGAWKRSGRSVGFVPTMGALHEGHLSLLRRARRENARVIASIFVNPLQFGPREDLGRYPRPFRRDCALLRKAGAHALYAPQPGDMYPDAFRTFVEVPGLSEPLCGRFRPGHFRGVATVVLKLLNRVQPDRLYLGEKDFQQLSLLRAMVRDLDLPVKVVGCRTVREGDGLALSSRNAYLDGHSRRLAPCLRRALLAGARTALRPGATPAAVRAAMRREALKTPGVSVDYLEVVQADSLATPRSLRGALRLAGAVRIGGVRLIDNLPLICKD